jgi:hypothetical protein
MGMTGSLNQVRFSEVCSRLSDQAPAYLASYSGESICLVRYLRYVRSTWILPIGTYSYLRHVYSLLIGRYTHILYS